MKRLAMIMFLACLVAYAGEGLKVSESRHLLRIVSNGVTLMDNDNLVLQTDTWQIIRNLQKTPFTVKRDDNGFVHRWEQRDDGLVIERRVRRLPDNAYRIEYDLELLPGIAGGKAIELTMHFRVAPMDFPAADLPIGPLTGPIRVPTLGGTIRIDPAGTTAVGTLALQDMRDVSWCQRFRLHFAATYDPATGYRGKVAYTISQESPWSPLFAAIALDGVANRSYADDIAGNGWTGQGPQNCLASFPADQPITAGGYVFQPATKALILRSRNTPNFPMSSGRVQLPKPERFASFGFLHTAAWSNSDAGAAVANYRVHYADGSHADLPLRFLIDVEDWWNVRNMHNALVAWTGDNGGGRNVAVFMSRKNNPHPERPVTALEFISTDSVTTVSVIAATGVRQALLTPAMAEELERQAGTWENNVNPDITADWFPCPIPWQDSVQPGSALDFSGLNHRPAGKYGFLRRVGDHFEFADRPGEDVRFWGTNFAITGPFPEKDLAPGIAKCMAAQGVNMVRMHLYAARPVLINSPDGTLKPDMLDRMQFLMAELIKNGVYIYMDLNDGMCYDQLLARPSTFPVEERLKLSSLFDPDLIRATKRMAELLFATVNPYTGKRPVDDPGIACYEIMNEISMLCNWHDLREAVRPPKTMLPKLEKLWHDWLRKNGHDLSDLPTNFSLSEPGRRFAIELDNAYISEMAAFLRNLGVRAPISATNITFANGNFAAAPYVDYFGDHFYWAHPNFRAQPKSYPIEPSLTRPVTATMTGSLPKSSLVGYPVVHSEWNYCYPNSYRCEGLPLATAYAAYQGWDGMIFYGATGSCDDGDWNRFRNNPNIQIHSQQTDPATWGLTHFAANLYRRGDVQPAQRDLRVVLPQSALYSTQLAASALPFLPSLGRFSFEFAADESTNWLGELAMQIDAKKEDLYDQVLKKLGDRRSSDRRLCSDTNELRRYPKPGLFLIDTPKSQCITGRLCDLSEIGDRPRNLAVDSTMRWATIALTTLDNAPIADSHRLLLCAVANAANTGQSNEAGLLMEMGGVPVLAENVYATISINNRHAADLKVYAVDPLSGARRQKLASQADNGTLTLTLDNSCKTLYFELTVE